MSIFSIPEKNKFNNIKINKKSGNTTGNKGLKSVLTPVEPPLGKKGKTSPPQNPITIDSTWVEGHKNHENFIGILDQNLSVDELKLSDEIHKNLSRKYENQNKARKILYNFERAILDVDPQYSHMTELEKHYKASNTHATIKCLRVKKKDADTVGIRVDHKNRKAIYTGLQNCSSPWACPVCASKIQTRRALEIKKAFDWAYGKTDKNGNPKKQYQMAMITLTFPHGISDDLGDTLEKLKLAYTYFRKGKNYDNYKKSVDYQGMIKAMELTWGSLNGWHPHSHELQIIDFDINEKQEKKIKKFISNKWEQACIKAGLLSHGDIMNFRKRAVDIIFKAKDSDYLAKMNDMDKPIKDKQWGADTEMAKASTKKGRMSGLSPFQMLEESDGNEQYQNLFLEYALKMKGKRQLVWSKGLKDKVGIRDKSDEEIADEETAETDLLALLTDGQWRIVLKNDDRAYVQWLAVNCGFEGLAQYFKEHGSILVSVEDVLGRMELARTEKVVEKVVESVGKKKKKKDAVPRPVEPITIPEDKPKMTAEEFLAYFESRYERVT